MSDASDVIVVPPLPLEKRVEQQAGELASLLSRVPRGRCTPEGSWNESDEWTDRWSDIWGDQTTK
jgi:hypothetical protein